MHRREGGKRDDEILDDGRAERPPERWQFGVDILHGHKTGFYLDQRENRKAAAAYLGGRRVLDLFCYTGGFAMTAAAFGGFDVQHEEIGKRGWRNFPFNRR